MAVGLGTPSCAPRDTAQRDTRSERLNLGGLHLRGHRPTRAPVPVRSLAAQPVAAPFGTQGTPPQGTSAAWTFAHQLRLLNQYFSFHVLGLR